MQLLAGPDCPPPIASIAHSMGNRVMLPALKASLQKVATLNSRNFKVVMAAPDVMCDTFNKEFDAFLSSTSIGLTLYANRLDSGAGAYIKSDVPQC